MKPKLISRQVWLGNYITLLQLIISPPYLEYRKIVYNAIIHSIDEIHNRIVA